MKRFLPLVFLLLTLTVSAQHKPFQFGFKAAGNLGWFSSAEVNYVNHGVRMGGSWGFVADLFLMENYSLTTGFDVLYLNGELEYPYKQIPSGSTIETTGVLTRKYNIKYLELPVVFTMKTNEIKGIRYYGQIGAGLGFRLQAKGKDSFIPDDSDLITESEGSVTDETRLLRASFILGAGVEFPLQGDTYLRTGLNYNNSFTNALAGDNAANTFEKNKAHNHYLALSVAVLF